MKGRPILISVLAVGLMLALVAGLTMAQGPEPQRDVTLQAALGTAFTYQGRLTDGGSPANGTYDFQFKLYDAASSGTQVGSTVTKEDVTVTDGLFTVELDFGSGVFTGDARYLEIGVRPGSSTGTYTTLSPRQALTPAPYALALPGLWMQQNASSPNLIGGYNGNSITAGVVGATIGGGGSPGAFGYGPWPNRVTDDYGTVGGGYANQAGDNAGTTSDAESATVGGGVGNNASYYCATIGGGNGNTASNYCATIGGGQENTASNQWATVGGGHHNTASGMNATIGGGGHGTANGDDATIGGGSVNTASGLYSTVGGGDHNTASGRAATVPGGSYNTAQGDYSFAAGRSAQANHDGAFVWSDSTTADFTSTGNDQFLIRAAGGVGIGTTNPLEKLHVVGRSRFDLGTGSLSISTPGGWPGIIAYSSNGHRRDIIVDDYGFRFLTGSSSSPPPAENGIRIFEDGTTRVQVLQITGGSDLAEPFEIVGAENIEPGMAVAIDPQHPGQLRIADKAYDRTVAGCVSGANGVNPGLTMQQDGTAADGAFPVALSGRVYCWADASHGPIQPGDLLTTSDTPGHVMTVTDHAKAQGAILGKAMTSLTEDKGLVLVLVSLQ